MRKDLLRRQCGVHRLRGLKLLLLGTAVGLLALPVIAQGQQQSGTGSLTMQSEEGDFIGAGEDYSLSSPSATFTFTAGSKPENFDGPHTVTIFAEDDENNFRFEFSSLKLAAVLSEQTYTDAQRAAFADIGHPGLSISGNGRGCNTLTGTFTITNFDWVLGESSSTFLDPPILISNFSAEFEQHCEGGEPALTGTISVSDPSVGGPGGGGGGDGDGGEEEEPPPPPDVRLILQEGRIFEIGNSRSVTVPVNVAIAEGWNHEVRLSAMSPKGISVGFEPSSLPEPGSGETSLTISVDPMTLPVRHAIPIMLHSNARVFEDMIFVDVVCDPPIILDQGEFQPTSVEVPAGERVTLSVNPTGGTEPYLFQWFEGSSYSVRKPVQGATARTFTTPPITQKAWYWVRVSNACGSRDSWIATLTPGSEQGSTTRPQRRRGTSRPGGGD